MCFIWKNEIQYMSFEKFQSILTEIDFVPLWFNLSGGETLLNPEFSKIVNFIEKKYPQSFISITTNGSRLDKLNALKNINNKTYLLFSIDGDENIHNEIRGNENAFSNVQKSLQRIKEFNNSNLSSVIATTLSEFNKEETFNFYQKHFSDILLNINIAQKSTYYNTSKSISFDEIKQHLRLLIQQNNKLNIQFFFLFAYYFIQKNNLKIPCSSIDSYALVDSSGLFRNCTVKFEVLKDNIYNQESRNHELEMINKSACDIDCESTCEKYTHITHLIKRPILLLKIVLYFIIFTLTAKIKR